MTGAKVAKLVKLAGRDLGLLCGVRYVTLSAHFNRTDEQDFFVRGNSTNHLYTN